VKAAARTLAVVALCALAAPARATPVDALNRARNAYAYGNYAEAIQVLRSVLYPLKLRDEDRIVEARQLLGVCHYFVKDLEAAREEFERLLYLRPKHELDPLLIPPPVIEFFEKVREKIRDRLARLHPEVRRAPAGPVTIVREVERRHLVLSFVPFGVGQFQNGRAGKAAFFLSAQVATLATNLITYAIAESKRLPDGRFDPRDEGLARNLRAAQIVSLSAFGALVAWGIVDAVLEYRAEVVRERRVEGGTGSGAPARTARPPGSGGAAQRLQWVPWAAAGGGGLGIGLRF
jgi:tetratricopeptide (TPR) repeat protein